MSKPKVIIDKPDKLVSLRSITMDNFEYKQIMNDDQQLEETLEEEQLREFINRVVYAIEQIKTFPEYERKYMALRIDHVDNEVSIVWDMSELELETLDDFLTNKSDISQHVTVSHRIE